MPNLLLKHLFSLHELNKHTVKLIISKFYIFWRICEQCFAIVGWWWLSGCHSTVTVGSSKWLLTGPSQRCPGQKIIWTLNYGSGSSFIVIQWNCVACFIVKQPHIHKYDLCEKSESEIAAHPYIVHYIKGQPFAQVYKTIVNIIEPLCITNVHSVARR